MRVCALLGASQSLFLDRYVAGLSAKRIMLKYETPTGSKLYTFFTLFDIND